MSMTIGQPGAIADLSGPTATFPIGSALLQAESAQAADVQALFDSLGLGATTDSAA